MIFDTSILIAVERKRFDLGGFLARHADETIAVAAITVSELLYGPLSSTDPVIGTRRAAAVETMLGKLFVLDFGMLEARQHAMLRASLSAKGKLIGPHDLLIAATALAQGHAVATLDVEHFSRVPGLRLVETAAFVRA